MFFFKIGQNYGFAYKPALSLRVNSILREHVFPCHAAKLKFDVREPGLLVFAQEGAI